MFDAISRSDHFGTRAATRDAELERASGAARLEFAPDLRTLYQRSPCRVLMPRIDGAAGREIVLVNTAGGIAGGDRFEYDISVRGAARIAFTTQAAEKIYRALDATARIETQIVLDDGAHAEWLPQETIVFEGGRLGRSIEISLAGGARVLALEGLVLGREAHGESLATGEIIDRWRVVRDGRLIWADIFRLTGDIAALSARPALLDGARAIATAIYTGADATRRLDATREALHGVRAGASVIDGILIARIAAADGAALRETVLKLLSVLRDGAETPRVWRS